MEQNSLNYNKSANFEKKMKLTLNKNRSQRYNQFEN